MGQVNPYIFYGFTALLAVMLFYPVNKLIWTTRMRRFERKEGRNSTEMEQQAELRASRVISAVIVIVFSFLFNRILWYS